MSKVDCRPKAPTPIIRIPHSEIRNPMIPVHCAHTRLADPNTLEPTPTSTSS